METQDHPTVLTLEQKLKNEFISWKYYSTFLYEQISSHSLEWPTLTIDTLPTHNYTFDFPPIDGDTHNDEIEDESEVDYQYVVIGTHTSQDEPNYLKLLRITVPKKFGEFKSFENFPDYNGFQFGNPKALKFQIFSQIYHTQEINRARACPSNSYLVATKAVSGDVLIYSMKGGEDLQEKVDHSQIHLKGHTKEGFGLSWSSCHQGYLASSANDGLACVWDINARIENKEMKPLISLNAHTQPANDIGWAENLNNIIYTCSDDGLIKMWDIRQSPNSSKPSQSKKLFSSMDCLAVFPQNDYSIASGSDSSIYLWDVRKFDNYIHTMKSHEKKINCLTFSNEHNGLLLSGSEDRFVNVWDINNIGKEQNEEDEEDGPPEMIFSHAGHSGSISDVTWVKSSSYTIISTSEENVIQIWTPKKMIFENENSSNLSSDENNSNDCDSSDLESD